MSSATEALLVILKTGGDENEIGEAVAAIAGEGTVSLDVFTMAANRLKSRHRDTGLAGAALVKTIDAATTIASNWVNQVHGGMKLSKTRLEEVKLIDALVAQEIDGRELLLKVLKAERGGVAQVLYEEERQGQARRVQDDSNRLVDVASARDSVTPLDILLVEEHRAAATAAIKGMSWKLQFVLATGLSLAGASEVFKSHDPQHENAAGDNAALREWLAVTLGAPEVEADRIASRYYDNYPLIRLRQRNPKVMASGAALSGRDVALLLEVTPGRVVQLRKVGQERLAVALGL